MSLRNERKKLGLKQIDVAQMIGVHQQRLSHYETGLRQPKPDLLKKLAKVYGCTIDALLEDDDDNNEQRKKRTRRKIAKTA